jgi:hypothetical protein
MSGITGGMNYGAYSGGSGGSGDGKFESFNNTNYTSSKQSSNYGHSDYYEGSGIGIYGNYGVEKSTLDKYREWKDKTGKNMTPSTNTTSTSTTNKNDATTSQSNSEITKKQPFTSVAPKL